MPEQLPSLVRSTVDRITQGLDSPYRQAKAINDFFTDGSQGFTYAATTIEGNNGNKLVDFLSNKQGFCEQYAATMAVMLRVKGIPSRVVIGYTPGLKGNDGRYTVTNHEAHAWVEAFFAGVGWAYFDPTPLTDGRTVAPGTRRGHRRRRIRPTGSTASANPSAGPTANQIPQEDLEPARPAAGCRGPA